jgi:hypothetical protein
MFEKLAQDKHSGLFNLSLKKLQNKLECLFVASL